MKNIIKYITAMAIVFSIAACQKTEPVSPSTSGGTTTQNNNSNFNWSNISYSLVIGGNDTTTTVIINGVSYRNKNGLTTLTGSLPTGYHNEKVRIITHENYGWNFLVISTSTPFPITPPWTCGITNCMTGEASLQHTQLSPVDTTFFLP